MNSENFGTAVSTEPRNEPLPGANGADSRTGAAVRQELQAAFGLRSGEFTACLAACDDVDVALHAGKNLATLSEIKEVWEDQFEAQALKDWLRQPVPLFKGKTPFEMLQAGKGAEVLHSLIRIKEGMHV